MTKETSASTSGASPQNPQQHAQLPVMYSFATRRPNIELSSAE
jgi:hypothetical protein